MTALDLMIGIGQIDDELLAEIMPSQKRKPPRRLLTAAVIAALLALLVGCSVAIALNYTALLETLFGANGRPEYPAEDYLGMFQARGERTQLNAELAKKYIDPNVFPVEGTLTDGVSTLTVHSCIVDRTSCTAAVYMKLDNPPPYDVSNGGWLLFRSEDVSGVWFFHAKANGQYGIPGRCIIDEASTTDEELHFVFLFSCEPTCMTMELTVGEGTDKITIPLPSETAFPSIIMDDGEIQITPFGMKVSADILRQDNCLPYRNQNEVAIRFRDGSEYLVYSTGLKDDEEYVGYTYGMALNFDMDYYVYVFNRIVEPGEIAAFRINEHIYDH